MSVCTSCAHTPLFGVTRDGLLSSRKKRGVVLKMLALQPEDRRQVQTHWASAWGLLSSSPAWGWRALGQRSELLHSPANKRHSHKPEHAGVFYGIRDVIQKLLLMEAALDTIY